jgi:hypothetical protein
MISSLPNGLCYSRSPPAATEDSILSLCCRAKCPVVDLCRGQFCPCRPALCALPKKDRFTVFETSQKINHFWGGLPSHCSPASSVCVSSQVRRAYPGNRVGAIVESYPALPSNMIRGMSLFSFLGASIEMLIVGAIILLLFGVRLPSVMRSLEKGCAALRCKGCGWMSLERPAG